MKCPTARTVLTVPQCKDRRVHRGKDRPKCPTLQGPSHSRVVSHRQNNLTQKEPYTPTRAISHSKDSLTQQALSGLFSKRCLTQQNSLLQQTLSHTERTVLLGKRCLTQGEQPYSANAVSHRKNSLMQQTLSHTGITVLLGKRYLSHRTRSI